MSFLDHIAACNNFSGRGYLPFVVDHTQVGHIGEGFGARLADTHTCSTSAATSGCHPHRMKN